jgi:hypothetical protein
LALGREPEPGDRLADFLADAQAASKPQADCSFDVDGARVRFAPPQVPEQGHVRPFLRVVQKLASVADGPDFAIFEMNYTFTCAERTRTTTVTAHYGRSPW